MQIKDLEYFVTLCRISSFTSAAEELFITQPALSLAIQRIEKELGGKLLVRARKGIKLTALGNMLYKEATQILNTWDNIQLQAADITKNSGRVAKIGINASYGRAFLPYIYSSIRKQHPEVEISFVVCKSEDLEHQLLDGEIDAAILWGSHYDTQLKIKPLFHQRMMLVMREDDENNQHGYIDAATGMSFFDLPLLGDTPLLSYNTEKPCLNTVVSEICRENNWEPHIASRFTESSIILAMVMSGMGVGIIPWDSIHGGNLFRIDYGIKAYNIKGKSAQCVYSFAYRSNKYTPRSAFLFFDICRDVHSTLQREIQELSFFYNSALQIG